MFNYMNLFIILLATTGFLIIVLLILILILSSKSRSSKDVERNERRVKSDLNKIKKQIES